MNRKKSSKTVVSAGQIFLDNLFVLALKSLLLTQICMVFMSVTKCFYLKFYLLLFYVGVFCPHMSLHHVHTLCSWRSGEVGAPGSGVSGGCELPFRW